MENRIGIPTIGCMRNFEDYEFANGLNRSIIQLKDPNHEIYKHKRLWKKTLVLIPRPTKPPIEKRCLKRYND